MTSHVLYTENSSSIVCTEPDIIIRQPITTQPSVNSLNSTGPWSYNPSGIVPLDRHSSRGNVDISSQAKPRPLSTTRDSISISTHSGSRDWSKDLFDSFKDVHRSKQKCSALTNLCGECFRIPCMMSNIANSLGDKSYLPFIPGTGAAIRFKVRILGGIHGTIANDCLVTSCCCPCATCQMYREIEDIGLGTTW